MQAMVEPNDGSDWWCAGLDDVIANMTKMAAVLVPDNIVALPQAKKSDKLSWHKTTAAGSTSELKQVLAKLLGTMESFLAADIAVKVDMVEEDNLDSNTPLAQAY